MLLKILTMKIGLSSKTVSADQYLVAEETRSWTGFCTSSFPLKIWYLKHHSSDCHEVKVLYEMLQLLDYCAKSLQQLLVNNKKLTPLCYVTVDIHRIFMEAFIYRLCYLLWKVGGAASLKKTDLSFITSSASLEYFGSTVGHISVVLCWFKSFDFYCLLGSH